MNRLIVLFFLYGYSKWILQQIGIQPVLFIKLVV